MIFKWKHSVSSFEYKITYLANPLSLNFSFFLVLSYCKNYCDDTLTYNPVYSLYHCHARIILSKDMTL